jgi:hypothetical protein
MFETKFVDKIKTRFIFNNFFPEDRAVYEIVWENVVEPDRPQMTLKRRMRFAARITKVRIQTQTENI